uniref:SWIM-type domain-containing protein n=1 Tax=Ditylenchus dipsaci TaxID=166011 RepID=A0A915DM81_9BILA
MEALPTRRGEQNSYFQVAAFEGDDAMAKVQQWKEDINSEWNKDGNKWQLKSYICPAVLRIRRIGGKQVIVVERARSHSDHKPIGGTARIALIFKLPSKSGLHKNLVETFAALHSLPSYTNWELYKENRSAIHILNHSNGWPNFYCCTCPVGIKKSPCKHSVMLMKIKGILSYPRDATAEPLLQKKKRGRPSN